jgi:hypothetical protein
MRELLEEVKKGAERHEPNTVKLRALPIDRRKIVWTFAVRGPMWQDVRHVIRMIGIL